MCKAPDLIKPSKGAVFVAIALILLLQTPAHNASAQSFDGAAIPFTLSLDAIARLLLINFEKDPDTLYIGFEPQVIKQANGAEMHQIIGWRKDGRVDVYHQQMLVVEPEKFKIAAKGLANAIAGTISTSAFTMTPIGLRVHYVFDDMWGRKVELFVEEGKHNNKRPFGLLAPMGMAAAEPSAMPCIFLREFYFIRQKHSRIQLSIGGKTHRPDKLPFPIDGKRMYFTRYSLKPLVVHFLPNVNGPIPHGGAVVTSVFSPEGDEQLGQLSWQTGAETVNLKLHNPMPKLETLLVEGKDFRSQFTLSADPSVGSISGWMCIRPANGSLRMQLVPSEGWNPNADRLSLRFLYKIAKIFKNWPKHYQWEATLWKNSEGDWQMHSTWTNNYPL